MLRVNSAHQMAADDIKKEGAEKSGMPAKRPLDGDGEKAERI